MSEVTDVVKTENYTEKFSVSAEKEMYGKFHIEKLSHAPGESLFTVTIFLFEQDTYLTYEVNDNDMRLVWDEAHDAWVLEYNNGNSMYRFLPGKKYPHNKISAPVEKSKKALEN